MALPTNGRVLINTTAGEIDIELWSKVRLTRNMSGLTCSYLTLRAFLYIGNTKNMSQFPRFGYGGFVSFSRISWFISLKRYTLGYYDGVIFHRFVCSRFSRRRSLHCYFYRIVPGFLVQTGDKTGTGAGGESFYGGS
jgi:peptidyl-prolyl cis-trans isomerase SDCCAG10